MKQIQNFVTRVKQQSGINNHMTLEELKIQCEENSSTPIDKDVPFIVAYDVSNERKVCIVWSTKKLLRLQHSATNICVDGTYKIMSLNWPILVNKLIFQKFIILNFSVVVFRVSNSRFHCTAIQLHCTAIQRKFAFPLYSDRLGKQRRCADLCKIF